MHRSTIKSELDRSPGLVTRLLSDVSFQSADNLVDGLTRYQEEKLMEKMSSTDTPLNTLTKLQHKTKEMSTPYVILSGNKASEPTSLKK